MGEGFSKFVKQAKNKAGLKINPAFEK